MLWARFPGRREATPSWSSPLTACPRPWRRHRPTRSSSRAPRAPLPRDSATSAGRSPIRAGAAPPASPGSSPTSAKCCAGSRARASATWSSPPSASRAITSRSSTISTSRRARSPTSSAFDSTAPPPPMTIPSSSPCSPTSSRRERHEGRSRVKLAIVGGGIAGLAAAHRACALARERALDLVLPRGLDPDESLGAFVRRRLGRQALERVAQPLVAGIYTADPDLLSLAATMPRFLELERRERSLILALWRAARRAPAENREASGARWSLFVTFAEGMEELVRALQSRIPPGAVRLKERVTGVTREGGRWRVATAEGHAAEADAVILACEAHQTARALRYTHPSLALLLEGIPYASSATVTLAWRRADIPHPLDGFGFVVPQTERRPVIACTFSSVKYPGRAPEGGALLRVFLGGAMNEGVLEGDDETLARLARGELAELLGVRVPPLWTRVGRYPP